MILKNRNTKPELTITGKLVVGFALISIGVAAILSILAIIKVFINYLIG